MPQVLLVDDNPADIDLASDALAHCRCPHQISAVTDGEQALAFLHGQGEYAGRPRPDLLLLDLNLPRKDGRAVLAEVKADPALRRMPVVILSTSQAQQDIAHSYDLGANSYVCKPGNLHDYIEAIHSIGEFWFGYACLPHEEEDQ
jgi:two-component system, chemotaxis family, response regulator Rcp1